MTTYLVRDVRREISASGDHLHITHLHTVSGDLWPIAAVALSITSGDSWLFATLSCVVSIRRPPQCPTANCSFAPYLETIPTSFGTDNLENAQEAASNQD